jgi:hypothetical protein
MKFSPLLLGGFLLAGCNGTITNLTSNQETRNTNGFYTVEAEFESRQQTLRWQDIHPSVVVDNDSYPMHRTALMTNRWETLIPLPEGKKTIYYRFKFDYDSTGFGTNKPDSRLSQIYRLEVLEPGERPRKSP